MPLSWQCTRQRAIFHRNSCTPLWQKHQGNATLWTVCPLEDNFPQKQLHPTMTETPGQCHSLDSVPVRGQFSTETVAPHYDRNTRAKPLSFTLYVTIVKHAVSYERFTASSKASSLQCTQSCTSPLKFQYLLVSLKSTSNCLHLPPRLLSFL